MWNNVCLCKVLVLFVFVLDTSGFKITKPLSREQIYIEVLKNITYVNDILNDLLDNYKDLKTIYETQVKISNELSAEKEVNAEKQVNAKIEVDVQNELKNNKTDYDPEFRPVTQMILLDEDFIEESSDKSSENIDPKENPPLELPDTNNIESNNKNKIKEKVEVSRNKHIIDLTRKNKLHQNQLTNIESQINVSNEPELIIIGPGLRHSQNMPINNEEENKDDSVDSTSGSKVNDFDFNKPILRAGNNIDEVNKNEYQYKDVDQSRQWRSSNEFTHYKGVPEEDISHSNDKPVFVFVVNWEQKDPLFDKNRYESDSEKSEVMLRRHPLGRKLLQESYGSECLKVPVRQCFKTLMQVRKLICTMDFKCRKSFKDAFKAHSKSGCETEFDDKGNKEIKNNDKKRKHSPYKIIRAEKNDNILVSDEISRSKSNMNYYELCLSNMMSEETNNVIPTKKKKQLHDPYRIEPIIMLRNHHEKECKRMSRERCQHACYYAVQKTCEWSGCTRDDRKSFKYTCRQECKYAFIGKLSDSDTDDDSDSDNDSDSDDSESNVTFE